MPLRVNFQAFLCVVQKPGPIPLALFQKRAKHKSFFVMGSGKTPRYTKGRSSLRGPETLEKGTYGVKLEVDIV